MEGVTGVLVSLQRTGEDRPLPAAAQHLLGLLRSWGPGPDHLTGLTLAAITLPSRLGPRFVDALVFTRCGVVVIAAHEPGPASAPAEWPGPGSRTGAAVAAARSALAGHEGGRHVTGLVAVVPRVVDAPGNGSGAAEVSAGNRLEPAAGPAGEGSESVVASAAGSGPVVPPESWPERSVASPGDRPQQASTGSEQAVGSEPVVASPESRPERSVVSPWARPQPVASGSEQLEKSVVVSAAAGAEPMVAPAESVASPGDRPQSVASGSEQAAAGLEPVVASPETRAERSVVLPGDRPQVATESEQAVASAAGLKPVVAMPENRPERSVQSPGNAPRLASAAGPEPAMAPPETRREPPANSRTTSPAPAPQWREPAAVPGVAVVLADSRGLRRIIAQHNRWRTVWSADDVLDACYALSLAHLAPPRAALIAEGFPARLPVLSRVPELPAVVPVLTEPPPPAAADDDPGPWIPVPRGPVSAVFPRPRPIRHVPWGLVFVLTVLVAVGVVAAVFVAQVFHGS